MRLTSAFGLCLGLCAVLALGGCSGGSAAVDGSVGDAQVGDAQVGDASIGDASVGDASASDAQVGDASTGDASVGDAGGPAVCTPGGTASCTDLARSWSGGQATCRADGSGWDVSACVVPATGQFEMVKPAIREPGRFADARCNDGTPFTFQVRLASSPSPVWLIYLKGGAFCDDYAAPCSERAMNLTTTVPARDGYLGGPFHAGVFNSDASVNPDFANVNQVFAYYCSSDFWAGATTTRRPSTGDPTNGWYFLGHANVDAMLGLLVERYGLDDSNDALRVLFGGGSAGALGAHFNDARVVSTLPRAAAAGRLKLFIDAGWMIDWDDPAYRIRIATTPDADVWRRARAFWAATFDPDCEAAAADPSTCAMAPNWYPYVAARQPVLIQQCAFDAEFTMNHGLTTSDAAASTWMAQVNASFDGVDWLFSGSDSPYHTLGIADIGVMKGPAGSTLIDVLHQFWTGGTPERVMF